VFCVNANPALRFSGASDNYRYNKARARARRMPFPVCLFLPFDSPRPLGGGEAGFFRCARGIEATRGNSVRSMCLDNCTSFFPRRSPSASPLSRQKGRDVPPAVPDESTRLEERSVNWTTGPRYQWPQIGLPRPTSSRLLTIARISIIAVIVCNGWQNPRAERRVFGINPDKIRARARD
jgi:hypothetical protein